MANFASISITFVNFPNSLENVQITASGTAVGTPVVMTEVARPLRLGSGQYTIIASVSGLATNLRQAFYDDYVYYQYQPFVVSVQDNVVTFTANEYGVTFASSFTGAAVTISSTPEVLPTLTIESITVETATTQPCLNVKQTINLVAGQEGTAPYVIKRYARPDIVAPTINDLFYELARSEGFSFYDTVVVEDANLDASSIDIPAVQYWNKSNVIVSSRVLNTELVNIDIVTILQETTTKDKTITLEAQITDINDNIIEAWFDCRLNAPTDVRVTNSWQLPNQAYKVSFRDDYGCTQVDYYTVNEEVAYTVESVYMKSNSLDFIEQVDYTYKNFRNTLYCDYQIKNSLKIPYFQKFLQTSNLWFQFQSNTPEIVVELISESGTSDISSSASKGPIEGGVNWWTISPNITSLDGEYQIRITFTGGGDSDIYLSQKFQVKESYSGPLALIKYKNKNDNYAYQDGLYWSDDKQEFLIDAEFTGFDVGADKTTLIDTNNRMVNIDSKNSAIDALSIYRIPYYLKEKFILALNHYYFEVNGIEYQMSDSPEITQFAGNTLYKGVVELQRVEYEIY
jgi:hypothetical protein